VPSRPPLVRRTGTRLGNVDAGRAS
jgi:hypothetical protein